MKCLIAVLAILVAATAAAGPIFYAAPSKSPASCPDQPCLTLDEYSKWPEHYFIDEATFQFLAGNHNDSAVYILSKSELAVFNCSNVTNFAIYGITLNFFTGRTSNNLSFFSFMHSNGILLRGLAFQGTFDRANNSIRAILIDNCSATIESCIFEGNTGYNGYFQ